MANELLFLRRVPHRLHPLCPRQWWLQLVRGLHDADAPIRRRADRQGRAGYQRDARRLGQRLVCPRDLAHELYDERLLPFGVQVYCPDNGGALRLTYDLRMQAAKSLREDSTLCLLWAMLMDSYSRWRTTWDVFNETGESYDL